MTKNKGMKSKSNKGKNQEKETVFLGGVEYSMNKDHADNIAKQFEEELKNRKENEKQKRLKAKERAKQKLIDDEAKAFKARISALAQAQIRKRKKDQEGN